MTTSGYQLSLVDSAAATLLELMENANALYRFDVLGQDATLGNPVPVAEAISSLMTDGGLTTIRSFGNRVAAFLVTITAPDAGALADGEAVLMAALDRVAALAWHVPFGASSFFDVVACWSEHQFDDLEEVRQVRRTFRVTFECLPFARSADLTTINWTGGHAQTLLNTTAGWTVVGGGAIQSVGTGTTAYIQKTTTNGSVTLSRSIELDDYLWIKTGPGFGHLVQSITINGVAIDDANVRREYFPSNLGEFYTIPTSRWRGQTATVQFTLIEDWTSNRAVIYQLWTLSYPVVTTAATATKPLGIGAIDVTGTARTPCSISFTAPAGGAFVYTAPDPNPAIRDRGAGESVYAKFSISDANGAEVEVDGRLMWFPPGNHTANVGWTDPRPLELYPNGMWPTEATGEANLGPDVLSGASQWAYPLDGRAAISFFDTWGAKKLISPSPSMPQGYHGDAVTHETHSLHPGRCGFAVLDVNGDPVAATVTYYARWKHHAAS